MKAGTFELTYNIELATICKATGEVLEKSEIKNTIVNTGLQRVAELLNGVDTTYFRAIAIGTGNTAIQATDTELDVEVDRATATLEYEASYKAKFSKTFSFASGVSYSIKEVGVFDSATASGSVMFNRALDAGKAVDADTDLTVTVTVTVATV